MSPDHSEARQKQAQIVISIYQFDLPNNDHRQVQDCNFGGVI
ncbi:hypothetical protein Z948_1094 [Sulfitobacter donghicola DSW-25 = KCTC 12864 = JCM 14565]|nr:hypothetical protein Z948_1094 [Sulfitobacter donghicola DSW-25 = KCTC 12864 = JCM 14565]